MIVASFAAVPASDNPITMMIGPTTIGGKILSIQSEPILLTISDTIRYTHPTAIVPWAIPGYPTVFIKATIGTMNEKLDPIYAGILPFVIRIYINVPTPELNKAIPGFSPTRIGTNTVEPNIENIC